MTDPILAEIKADLETGRDISSGQQQWLVGEVERHRGLLARLDRESLTCPVCDAVLHLGDRHGLDSDGQPCWLAAELRTERPCTNG